MANKPNASTATKKTYAPIKPQVLQGLVYWCKVFEPDEMSGKYCLDLALSADGVKLCSELNIPIKNMNDDRGSYARFYAFAKDLDGNPVKFTEIFDAGMKAWDKGLIGNGSLVNVEFYPKNWEYGNKTGTRGTLLRLQVLKHIPYGAGTQLKAEPEYIDAADETAAFTAE